jgi:hypothetical protein
LVTHGDLTKVSGPAAGNERVVDGHGNAYVNGGGFNLMAGEPFAPGIVALISPDGAGRQVADGLAFPNGMLVTADNETLIIAESYAKRLTAFDIANDGRMRKKSSSRFSSGTSGRSRLHSARRIQHVQLEGSLSHSNSPWRPASSIERRCVRRGDCLTHTSGLRSDSSFR